jgi:hypothetical protein
MPSRLKAAIPKLASLNIERSVAFFERLGFARRYFDKDYGIVERDGVQLHFWLCVDPRIPKETGCRITVEGIDGLFEAYAAEAVIHPNGRLGVEALGRPRIFDIGSRWQPGHVPAGCSLRASQRRPAV